MIFKEKINLINACLLVIFVAGIAVYVDQSNTINSGGFLTDIKKNEIASINFEIAKIKGVSYQNIRFDDVNSIVETLGLEKIDRNNYVDISGEDVAKADK